MHRLSIQGRIETSLFQSLLRLGVQYKLARVLRQRLRARSFHQYKQGVAVIYRIIVTAILLIAIVAVGVSLEEPTGRSNSSVKPAPVDDGAMKSLRIN